MGGGDPPQRGRVFLCCDLLRSPYSFACASAQTRAHTRGLRLKAIRLDHTHRHGMPLHEGFAGLGLERKCEEGLFSPTCMVHAGTYSRTDLKIICIKFCFFADTHRDAPVSVGVPRYAA